MGGKQSTLSLETRIERAEKLGILTLHGLNLKELPDRIDAIEGKLKELDVSDNPKLKLSEYPQHAPKWIALKGLACSGNSVQECGWVCLCPSLERLNLSRNEIAVIPSSVFTALSV